MTEVGQIIATLELCPPEDVDHWLRQAALDPVAAHLLRLTFDPFLHWRHEVVTDFPDIDPVKSSQMAEKEWAHFASLLESQSLTEFGPILDAAGEWTNSPAWSLYYRILAKSLACDTVSRHAVSTALGTVPQFYAGLVVEPEGVRSYPCALQPFVPGTRCLAIVSHPKASNRDAWFLSESGLPFPVAVPESIRHGLVNATYKSMPADPFADGIVFDGVINMAGYSVFDCVPLTQFREQARTDSLRNRLESFAEVVFGDQVHAVPTLAVRKEGDLAQAARVIYRRGFGAVVAKDPEAPYPYFAEQFKSQAWTLLPCTCGGESKKPTHLPNCPRFVPTFP